MIKGQYDQKAYDSSIPGASGVGGQPSTPSTETDSSVNTEETKDPKTDVAPPADKQVGVSPQNNADALIGYDQQIAMLENEANVLKPETEEERKKRERREKSRKIVAAVSDGLQALSNLFFTTRGAPSMYDYGTNGQLSPLQTKLDKLKAERQANADKYLQYSLKIGDLRNERAKTLREMEAEQEKRKLAREKAQREQEEHGWLAALQPDKLREQKGKADKAGYEADTAGVVAEFAPKQQQAKLETERAHKNAYVASANASNAAANNSNTLAKKNAIEARGRYPWYDENGNVHYAKTENEALYHALQHGTTNNVDVDDQTRTTNSDVVQRGKVVGKRSSKTTTSKKVFYPGIRKRPAAAKPQPKPAPKPAPKKGGWASGLNL